MADQITLPRATVEKALEALVAMNPSGPIGSLIWHQQMEAITALSDALAQAEPVRALTDDERAAIDFFSRNPSVALLAWAHWMGRSKSAPTAAQQQRKPLTDEEKQTIHNETGASHSLICLVESYINGIKEKA